LRFLNALKEEELDKLKTVLTRYDKVMEKREDWKKLREGIFAESTCE
jgi:hypothetical protein